MCVYINNAAAPRHRRDVYVMVPAETTSTGRVGEGPVVVGLKIGERVGRTVGCPGTGIGPLTDGRNPVCGAGDGSAVSTVGSGVGVCAT